MRPTNRNIKVFVEDFHEIYINYEQMYGKIPTEIGGLMIMTACRPTREHFEYLELKII